ncbi:META domain-containing protein [Glutamicibacter sp. MNS18]|uniref:META domain-containing protein n=1 Tax=Glutamicibacter sp. MNS18 TaxID=2989817 RepID=UPI002235898A|nr:META domain-containing protein [Glutamicibacter sp. MNS18]MCW4466522.1 META domain-containing protein [Glutamicibacter sp. MNS18]
MKRLALALVLSAVLISTAACSSSGPSGDVALPGIWGSQDEGQPWLELSPDGTASGSDGCNRLMGEWTADGSEVTLAPVATTRMYCEGVDTWLSGIDRATVEGDTLRVFNQGDEEIGTLHRH